LLLSSSTIEFQDVAGDPDFPDADHREIPLDVWKKPHSTPRPVPTTFGSDDSFCATFEANNLLQEVMMRKFRKLGTAMVLAGMIAGAMVIGTTRVEAKGRKGGVDPIYALCTYLQSVINYPYVSPTIQAYAQMLYDYYSCDTVLAQ
jgi:hypothetical protein